jgi:hypothetical protein
MLSFSSIFNQMVKYTKIYWINKEVVIISRKLIKNVYKTVLYIF